MALTTKRIIALPSQTDPQEGDYLAIDNATSGTHKIPVGRIGVEVDDTLTEAGKAADAKAVGDALDEIRSQVEVTGTASGAIATFTDGAEMPAKSLIVNIEPVQSGTGTPSPTNIRPIRGHSGVNAYVSPTQSADDGTKYSQEFDVSLTPTSTDKVPYTFKAVGQDVYGDRESDKIVGGTVAWNQLYQRKSDYREETKDGITFTPNSDGTWTINGTATANAVKGIAYNAGGMISGHKYICGSSAWENGKYGVAANSYYANKDASYWMYNIPITLVAYVTEGTTVNNVVLKPQLFDLTAMFGSTIADYIYSLEQATTGAGVAWFKKLFPKPYYAYNAGELMSVQASSHDMVGFNAWDEEWELGALSATGGNATSSTEIRSKNYIPVVGGQTYYLYCAVTSTFNCKFYDADKNFISGSYISRNSTLTIPNDARYMRFFMGAAYGTTYNNDICINLSDPTRNGEYEPYIKHSYPLDSSLTLRGIPKLDASNNLYYDGDTYESDGTVTRKYGIVDLGTLTWVYTSYGDGYFYASVPTIKLAGSWNAIPNVVCPKYLTGSGNDVGKANDKDKVVSVPPNQAQVIIKDKAYTDAAAFKTAMSGVYLVYELATPTTETADPFTDPQEVSIYGTEEFVSSNGVPVGNKTTYKTRDIFGGTLDVVTGVLTAYPFYPSYNGETLDGRWICDRAVYAEGATPPTGSQVALISGTGTTYQLTPTEIQTLLGENNVWADAGDVEVVYVRDLNITINNLLNNNGTRSLGMMAMSAPTDEQTEEPAEDDMR